MREFLNDLMGEQWGAGCGRFDGTRSFATDGHGFLIVDGVFSEREIPSLERQIKKIVADRKPSETRVIPIETLLAWLPNDAPFATCETCGGGSVQRFACERCRGSGLESCHHCGHASECSTCGGAKWSTVCPDCGGDGKTRRKKAPAWLSGDVLMDRRLVQRFFAQLSAVDVTISWAGPADPVFFEAPGWVMGLMPMRSDSDDDEAERALFP